jgi:hypothetical protein
MFQCACAQPITLPGCPECNLAGQTSVPLGPPQTEFINNPKPFTFYGQGAKIHFSARGPPRQGCHPTNNSVALRTLQRGAVSSNPPASVFSAAAGAGVAVSLAPKTQKFDR